MTLAAHLGLTLHEAQNRVSSREFTKWIAEYKRNPWGEQREDIRFSALMALLANLWRDPKRHPKPYSWEDFKFEFGYIPDNEPERSVEELIKVAAQWTQALGGIDKRVKKPN